MLSEIYIQNLAVIEQATIDFTMGLNIFTGETGAGKSIVVDSINAVLGQRISKEIIRTGCDKAVIMGVFCDVPKTVAEKVESFGYQLEDDQLVIQREIQTDGKNSARLCGRPVNIAVLKEICNDLVNIHGQHDSQVLLISDQHIHILDSFGDYQENLSQYQELFAELKSVVMEMERLSGDEKQKEQRIDLLSYQVNEITSANLKLDEDKNLESEIKLMRNYSKIADDLSRAYACLNGDDESGGATELLSLANDSLLACSEFHESIGKLSSELQDAYYAVQDVSENLSRYLDNIDFDPKKLEMMEDRFDEIRRLKHKYGDSIEEIADYLKKAQEELSGISHSEERFTKLSEKRHQLMEQAKIKAEKISELRKKAADDFIHSVEEELKFLDMPNVVLDVSMQPCKLNRFGKETVEFLISTNAGEPPKPISRIASGGELSRIMLAIKNTLADKDSIPTMIFDEVDTGVSGRAAQKIGLKLKEAAHNKQVICVTHLAQIAALADTHFLIQKETQDNRTFTKVNELDFDGRVKEVARIMGTGNMTDLLLKNAESMILDGQQLTK